MKYIVIFLLFVIFESSSALTCNRCKNPSTDLTCKEVEDEKCPVPTSDSPKEPACLKHIYEDANKQTIVEKKCVIKDKNKKYECVPLAKVVEQECIACNDRDNCNSADSLRHLGSLAVMLGLLLLLLR